ISDNPDSAAGVQLLFEIRYNGTKRDRGDRDSSRVGRGCVLRPAQCLRESGSQRIGLTQAPVVAEAPDHETITFDEFILRRKNRTGGGGGPATSSGRRGSRIGF